MTGMDGLELLAKNRGLRPETLTLLITGHGDHDLAIQALRGGAYDFFFFQAEDGIRDLTVTGVQTCALPILRITLKARLASAGLWAIFFIAVATSGRFT